MARGWQTSGRHRTILILQLISPLFHVSENLYFESVPGRGAP